MTGPLHGIRIIDLTNMLMGPYATQILGDMGADVIKVEPPEGDAVRGIGPLKTDGMGPMFLGCNRSKRSIVLNLKTPGGLAAMKRLIADADVLIYNRRPQAMDRLGLDYDTVKAINPRIIYAGLYGYGQNGPYAAKPAFDDLIQGAVALPSLCQQATGAAEPYYVPSAVIDRGVGLWAVGQINGALLHQARSGEGQRLDLPMFEMMTSFVLGDHMAGQTFEPPLGPPGYARLLSPDRRPFPTKDSYICVMVYTDRHWRAFFDGLTPEDNFPDDERFASITTRTNHIASIYADLARLMATRTTAEWLEFFAHADIPAMPLHTLETLMADPHLAATGFFQMVEQPGIGRIRDIAVPATWSATQPARQRPVPALGEHSDAVLREIGYGGDEIAALRAAGAING